MKRDPRLLSHARELRRNQTPAESALWKHLRGGRFLELRFRRQQVVGRYILDFYSSSRRIAIEIDGDVHIGREPADERRTAWLASQGIEVLRFWNNEVHQQLEAILALICDACERREGLDKRCRGKPRQSIGNGDEKNESEK